MKRKFEVQLTCTLTVELDDSVIAAVDDSWRKSFYPLRTPEDIAEHIAYNLVVNNAELSELDGFADQSNDAAKIIEPPDWETEAIEISPPERRKVASR
jgi:hypothetical protein